MKTETTLESYNLTESKREGNEVAVHNSTH